MIPDRIQMIAGRTVIPDRIQILCRQDIDNRQDTDVQAEH